MRVNGWFGCNYGHWGLAVHLWPSLEIQWTHLNCSLHFELSWLVWETKLNLFFKPEPKPVLHGCICMDCAVCKGTKTICGECGMCTRCHSHQPGCKGCPHSE